MTCSLALDEDRAERYLEGGLPAEEQAHFEDHYFECDDCLHAVQALQALPAVVARAARLRRARWLSPVAVAVAALALGALGLLWPGDPNGRDR